MRTVLFTAIVVSDKLNTKARVKGSEVAVELCSCLRSTLTFKAGEGFFPGSFRKKVKTLRK